MMTIQVRLLVVLLLPSISNGFLSHVNTSPTKATASIEDLYQETTRLAAGSSSSDRLSHVMLRVPSVDETVRFWTTELQGTIVRSTTNADGTMKSAFVTLGSYTTHDDNDDDETSFALEIVASTAPFHLGSCINYLGISMLLLEKQASSAVPDMDVNGIPLRRVASAPGDNMARFSLVPTVDLDTMAAFYTDILRMESKGQDESMLCLRYSTSGGGDNNSDTSSGVPTTLLFEAAVVPQAGGDTGADTTKDHLGNCLDHLAIATNRDIETEYARIQATGTKIFLKPTPMFGKTVMGVVDPSGFRIVLAGK